MAAAQQQILHRVVPLVCQALLASADDAVWLDGLVLLASAKLRPAMALTSSIWLPLLLRGLDRARAPAVVGATLALAAVVAETLEPIKSCLLKPLRALCADDAIAHSDAMVAAVGRLGLRVRDRHGAEVGLGAGGSVRSAAGAAVLAQRAATAGDKTPLDHPILADIVQRNVPPRARSVQQAWTNTLLSSAHEVSGVWLHNLYQATLEACAVPEMVITHRLGPMLHDELFQTAFLKCYTEIDGDFRAQVDAALARLLLTGGREIGKALLDLVGFLDKEGIAVSPEANEAARQCAKRHFEGDLNNAIPPIVLWYAEQETLQDLSAENVANLVEINIRNGSASYDSAWGTMKWLQYSFDILPEPKWITQLSHWHTALKTQNERDRGKATTFSSLNTRLICHHALGQYKEGYELAQTHFDVLNDHERRKAAHWATAAAWHTGDYESMADWLAFHPKGTSKSLYKAIIDVHASDYASAFHHIAKSQALSYDELQIQLGTAPLALKTLAKTELLVELQEAIAYRSRPAERARILETWRARFKRSHPDANSWLKRLQVWTLACAPTQPELQPCILDCAKLCESTGMREAAQRLLDKATPETWQPGCKVEYTRLRLEWKDVSARVDEDAMRNVRQRMQLHLDLLLDHHKIDRRALESQGLGLQPVTAATGLSQRQQADIARRYHRLAQWTEALQGHSWTTDPSLEVYTYYSLVCKLDKDWFTGSYSLSQAAMHVYEAGDFDRSDTAALSAYVVPAIRGLFQAVRSRDSPERKIRVLLRLVTLWFRYGESSGVLHEVETQLAQTPIDAWLLAIPQLIARLGTRDRALQGVLVDLLRSIAFRFPHAVIWPLLTASQTRKVEHQNAAKLIMDHICSMPDGVRLVSQAELVGRELIRSSISWYEKWRAMIDHLLPRDELMNAPWAEVADMWDEDIQRLQAPETPSEAQFVQHFGDRLVNVYKTLVKYRSTRHPNYVNTAYTKLFTLDAYLSQWKAPGFKLDLASEAPRLLALRDCILTVPGKYDHSVTLDDQAFIDGFDAAVDVLPSKQMPRKLVIRSYKSDFTFLLKGNEDLRGDERIMQLLTLVNTLLNHDTEAFQRHLHLLPYEVIPLSPEAGLVSWVPNTQTLQGMIAAHRAKKHSNLSDKELASMLGYDPDSPDRMAKTKLENHTEMERYDKLPVEQKVRRLENALSHSEQSDLREILWQRSLSAEIWIRRRTNLARTLGVGSIVGYIIGLGDRHGSNILIDQLTWGALHIDFGDLFNVARERSTYPEKVPFRLTRMMTNSFELVAWQGHAVPGSRGNFKHAGVVSMTIMRDNRSTLLAMLEAFLYDPLLSWTADTHPSTAQETKRAKRQNAVADTRQAAKKNGIAPEASQRQSVPLAPLRSLAISAPNAVHEEVEEAIGSPYIEGDSYMAKAGGAGMTNARALHVLAQIERKLAGYNDTSERPLTVKDQVQELIREATAFENLAQGYVLGWQPWW
ncbi:hypothetical protein Q5752_001145 [Cryptotrichosporon argae]